MILNLAEVRRIAKDVASEEDPALEVIAARASTGGSAYIELTLQAQRNGDDPSRVVIVADRSRGEASLRRAIARELRLCLVEQVVRRGDRPRDPAALEVESAETRVALGARPAQLVATVARAHESHGHDGVLNAAPAVAEACAHPPRQVISNSIDP